MITITCPNMMTTVGANFTAKGDYGLVYERGDWRALIKVFKDDGTKIYESAANNFANDVWSEPVDLSGDPPTSPSTITVSAELQTRADASSPWETVEAVSSPVSYVTGTSDPCANRPVKGKKKKPKKKAPRANTASVLQLTMTGTVRPSTTAKPTRLLMRVGGKPKGYKSSCLVLDPFRTPITLSQSDKGWILLQTAAGGHAYDFEMTYVIVVPPGADKPGKLLSCSGRAEVTDGVQTLFCFGTGTWKCSNAALSFSFVPDPRAILENLRPTWKKLP